MGRIAIFIDGAYLSYTLKDEFGSPRIDFQKLVNRMAGGREILRSYYYNCEPYQSNPPTPEERARFGKAQAFISSTETARMLILFKDVTSGPRLTRRSSTQS